MDGVGRCKLLHLEYKGHEVLPCSTGTVPNLLGQTMMGDDMRKRKYRYAWLGHLAVHRKLA